MSHDQSIAKYFARATGNDDTKKTYIDNYINLSPYPKEFRTFMAEFCAQTGAVLSVPKEVAQGNSTLLQNPKVFVRTPNFMPAGSLWVTMDEGKPLYHYSAKHVYKQRAKNGEKNTRFSTKISSLLTSLRKSSEFPTDAIVAEPLVKEIRACFGYALAQGMRPPGIDLPNEIQISLVERILNSQPLPTHHVTTIETEYAKYAKLKSERDGKQDTMTRYREGGYWAIGFPHTATKENPSYYVAEMALNTAKNETAPIGNTLHYKRSLEHLPDVHMALMFAKPFFEKEYPADQKNVYHVPRVDKYFPDLDIGIGYQSGERIWVFIPKASQ